MVVDTSAIIAIFNEEADYQKIASALSSPSTLCYISAASVLEAYIVTLNRKGVEAWSDIERLIEGAEIQTVSITEDVLSHAMEAYRRYGKGRHPAKLNFGDCFSYGLAKVMNEPLLFVGGDFTKTDIEAVL
jgi:ribonuclease VapC